MVCAGQGVGERDRDLEEEGPADSPEGGKAPEVDALRESVTLQVVENHYPLVMPANDSLYLLEVLVLWGRTLTHQSNSLSTTVRGQRAVG